MVIWLDNDKPEDKAIIEVIQEKLRKAQISFTAVRDAYYAHSRDILQDVYQDMMNYVQHGMHSKNPKFIMSIHDIKQKINDSRFDDIGDIVIVHKHCFGAGHVGIIDHRSVKQSLQEICDRVISSLNDRPTITVIDGGIVTASLRHYHYDENEINEISSETVEKILDRTDKSDKDEEQTQYTKD